MDGEPNRETHGTFWLSMHIHYKQCAIALAVSRLLPNLHCDRKLWVKQRPFQDGQVPEKW